MRMGWGRRTLALLGLMMILALPQAALGEGAFTMAGFDGDNGTHVWETNGFFARMEKRTGVSFTFEQHSDYAAWNARKDAMFAAGELPDVFFKAELTTDELIRYTESGQLVDLAPLLEANAPNLWALLQQHPDWLAAITLPSGKIGALPTLNTLPSQNAMWINQTWLDNLGLAAPTDAESFREVLRAFLTQDPNRNGKQDEIPLTFNGVWDLKFLLHAFGLAGNDYNLYLDEAGQVRFVPLEEAYPAALAYLRSLYEEKLLYQYGFNTADTLRTVTDENTAETYGVVLGASPMQLIPYAHSKDYVLLMPLQYEGKQVYRDLFGPVTRGTFAITSACADPAALLRWVDVLYTEEGAIEAFAGVEDTDYRWNADGTWGWFGGDAAMTESVASALTLYDSGNMPWLFPRAFYQKFDNEDVRRVDEQLSRLNAVVRRPFPYYTLTQEQQRQAVAMQDTLGAYVDECMGRMILGQTPLDEAAFEAFRQGLQERGVDEFIAFWQAIASGL